jgi:hypothetical protein
MLNEWEKRHPGRVENIFSALSSVTPSHLLDRRLFDFAAIAATGLPDPEGDIGFDVDRELETAIGATPSVADPDTVQSVRIVTRGVDLPSVAQASAPAEESRS